MYINYDMAMTTFAAAIIGLVCAPKRAITLLLVLDIMLVLIVEAYASSRLFHSFGDSLFWIAINALVSSLLAFVILVLILGPLNAGLSKATQEYSSRSPWPVEVTSASGRPPMSENKVSMLFHLSGLTVLLFPLLNLAAALGFWICKRKAEPFTAYHASAMLAFHCVYVFGYMILAFIHPFLAAIWFISGLVLICRAAYLAYRGRYQSYPGADKLLSLFRFSKQGAEQHH